MSDLLINRAQLWFGWEKRKHQNQAEAEKRIEPGNNGSGKTIAGESGCESQNDRSCLLYTSDAADE